MNRRKPELQAIVEFDGHRLDLRLKVVVRDPLGFEHEFEIERVWLLVIIDVCMLGYHLVVAREYSGYGVIRTAVYALRIADAGHLARSHACRPAGLRTEGQRADGACTHQRLY